jgi:hypothetical protein
VLMCRKEGVVYRYMDVPTLISQMSTAVVNVEVSSEEFSGRPTILSPQSFCQPLPVLPRRDGGSSLSGVLNLILALSWSRSLLISLSLSCI